MATDSRKRLELDAWLHDLRRLGGKARTLSERHESLQSLMDLADLRMLEEATKRIIVSLSKKTLYGLPQSRGPEGASRAGAPRPGAGLEAGLLLPARDLSSTDYASSTTPSAGPAGGVADRDGSHRILRVAAGSARVPHPLTKARACP